MLRAVVGSTLWKPSTLTCGLGNPQSSSIASHDQEFSGRSHCAQRDRSMVAERNPRLWGIPLLALALCHTTDTLARFRFSYWRFLESSLSKWRPRPYFEVGTEAHHCLSPYTLGVVYVAEEIRTMGRDGNRWDGSPTFPKHECYRRIVIDIIWYPKTSIVTSANFQQKIAMFSKVSR